jgi:hypothetical protein
MARHDDSSYISIKPKIIELQIEIIIYDLNNFYLTYKHWI